MKIPKKDKKEVKPEVKKPVEKIEKPQFDPNLPENKQRWLR